AGEQVLPYDVYITNYHVDNGDWPNIADIVNQNKNIDVDVSMLEAGKYSMHFLYEYPEADYDFWFIMTFEIE
ncbi:MAG TPA: hypothetical protein DCY20_09445, partial [Firmicutes bacterium]|nr:hypothetical protein [Bacillota bacterium]